MPPNVKPAREGTDSRREVNEVAEKKIAPKPAASKSTTGSKKAAATRVTKKKTMKKYKKA
jgi:hypothetical protein